jgi:hypothetical protein
VNLVTLCFDTQVRLWCSTCLLLVCETPKLDLSSTTKCDHIHNNDFMNLVTLKAGAKHELLFYKPGHASEVALLSKSLCLAAASDMTKYAVSIVVNLVTLCFIAKVRLRCSTNLALRPVC